MCHSLYNKDQVFSSVESVKYYIFTHTHVRTQDGQSDLVLCLMYLVYTWMCIVVLDAQLKYSEMERNSCTHVSVRPGEKEFLRTRISFYTQFNQLKLAWRKRELKFTTDCCSSGKQTKQTNLIKFFEQIKDFMAILLTSTFIQILKNERVT